MSSRVASWPLAVKLLGVLLPASLLIMGGGAFFVQQPLPIQLACLAALAVLLLGLTIWLTNTVLAPVHRITEAAGRIARGELAARAPSGSRDAVGDLSQALNAMADELERRVRELESQGRQAQAILESMVEGVLALDREGRILWLNGSAQQLIGTTASQAVGIPLTQLFRQTELEDVIREALTEGRPSVREVQAFAPQERVVQIRATPCGEGPPPAAGQAGGTALVLVAQDVTDIRRLERIRREFVGNVSHELKTPLTSIKGLLETLLNGALEDPANNRRFVTLIDEDATRLGRLIDDLLELSQIESKAAALRLQPVALRPLIEALVQRFRPQLEARQVTPRIEMPADLPTVQADPDRLRQVFSNLLDNAIKFSNPGGTVTLQAAVEGATMRISVADTGVGIPEVDLPRIFERFYRVDKARSRDMGGTGLGLAIVKHLVELHQGRVLVDSRLGTGSTFTVVLPISQSLSS